MLLAKNARGMTLAGECFAMSRPTAKAAASEAIEADSIVTGKRLTSNVERNSASRVALPMTCAAIAPAAVNAASHTKPASERDLDFTTCPVDLKRPAGWRDRCAATTS